MIAINQILLVELIQKTIILPQPSKLYVLPNKPQTDGVYSPDVKVVDVDGDVQFDEFVRNTSDQLLRRLFRKGRNKDTLRLHPFFDNQIQRPLHEGESLSGSRTGNNQYRAFCLLYRF